MDHKLKCVSGRTVKRRQFHDLLLDEEFFTTSLIEEKIDRLDFVKIKNFYTSKYTIKTDVCYPHS